MLSTTLLKADNYSSYKSYERLRNIVQLMCIRLVIIDLLTNHIVNIIWNFMKISSELGATSLLHPGSPTFIHIS